MGPVKGDRLGAEGSCLERDKGNPRSFVSKELCYLSSIGYLLA